MTARSTPASAPELVVLIGLQGSGKSTFRRTHYDATHVVVSKDLFRHHRRPSERQRYLVTRALMHGRSVVVDNTNPTPADRAELILLARSHGARAIACFFPPDIRASLARNARRVGKERVPAVAIFATRKKLVPPSLEEGFDAISWVQPIDEDEAGKNFRIHAPSPGALGQTPGSTQDR